jgi:hypothetical protein
MLSFVILLLTRHQGLKGMVKKPPQATVTLRENTQIFSSLHWLLKPERIE